MKKLLLAAASLGMVAACAVTTVSAASVSSSHSSSSAMKMMPRKKPASKPKKCVNNLMCIKGKMFVCINGKPSCVDAAPMKKSSSSALSSAAGHAATNVSVSIRNIAFAPNNLTVKKGTTVTWTNGDSMRHSVTGDNGGPNSDRLEPGASYSYTFNATGSFPYHCIFHPGMHGMVTVQ